MLNFCVRQDWLAIGGAAANATSFVDTTGEDNVKYYYRVRGTNSAGVSDYSNLASATRTVEASLLAPHIESITRNGSTVTLLFTAQAGQTYSLLASATLNPALWQKVADVAAQATTGVIPVSDNDATGATRFYKLVSPQQP